jgi:hypothetical protein
MDETAADRMGGFDSRFPEEPKPRPPLDPLATRLWKVFVSPREVFRGLAAEPVALGAIVLGTVLMALMNLAIPTEFFEEALRTRAMETGQDVPGDPVLVARFMKLGAAFGILVVWPVIILGSAGLYALVLLFGFGFQGTYRQYLAVTAHAVLVPAVAGLLLVPLKVMTQDPQLSLSVGSLFFFLEEGLLSRFLDLLDLFNLWSYVLVGIGAAAVDGSRSPRTAISATVGIALLISLVVAAFTG